MINKTQTTREQKYCAAEGLLNHLEDLKSRGDKIEALIRFSEKVYAQAREHEREDNYDIANQN